MIVCCQSSEAGTLGTRRPSSYAYSLARKKSDVLSIKTYNRTLLKSGPSVKNINFFFIRKSGIIIKCMFDSLIV